ncbi:DUF885 domain-containing protein [Propioniciclava coleopterorum]|uniref:DUF885 domain-containing protein n=1 Tax=Propioniciclava coleopterorum TaxID=2714937 RepID=UPI001FE7B12D|nr:DUF885 domain-containing protein [Propioniciclava coleopterorum]
MRENTAIDQLAEDHTRALVAASPLLATVLGVPGSEHLLDDLSPAGHDAMAALNRATLSRLADLEPVDATDEVTAASLRDRLGLELESHEAGDHERDLNNIASPVQGYRDGFDLMPTATAEHWAHIAARMSALPDALAGYAETLRAGVAHGRVPALRQVELAVAETAGLADADGSFFTTFAAGARPDGSPAAGALAEDLARGAAAARSAYATLSQVLRDEIAPHAPQEDAVGRERYARASRYFLGATVDLDETYEWGVEELARITAEQEAIAREIAGPDATVADAVAALDADPARRLVGTAALKAWMQERADEAIAKLNGVQFDIPEPLLTIECMIAPTQSGGIYYTGPTDDWSRPGRMWWSVPPQVTEFNTWRELTTVYHEGVPGHHLQIGQAVYNADELNWWRRQICWLSGHGEGWALYSERLMDEFGFLQDPGDRFGMLDSQRLRATRVVLDLGVHLGKPAFARYGGGTWDYDKAWQLMKDNVNMDDGFLRFELNRYMGWPGQAPSYKVGQRLWEQIRTDAAAAAGEDFSLRDFHRRALNLGSVPLDVLRDALLG